MQAKRTYKLVGVLALSVNKKGVTCFSSFFISWKRAETIGRLPKSAAMDVASAYRQAVRKTCLFSSRTKITKGFETANSLQG